MASPDTPAIRFRELSQSLLLARSSTPTYRLAETAIGVREVARNIGRARVRCDNPRSVMVVCKIHDAQLIRFTHDMTRWIIDNIRARNGDNIIVYIDEHLRSHPRFDYARLIRLKPEYKSQIKFWTPLLCLEAPSLIDFVITLGGDGTVLYTSWLFQHIVPPVIPFHLGSLGFLTVFDFSNYKTLLKQVFEQSVRVNLRMRFTCTVFRAQPLPDTTSVGQETGAEIDSPVPSPASRASSFMAKSQAIADSHTISLQKPPSLRQPHSSSSFIRPRANSSPALKLAKRSSLSQLSSIPTSSSSLETPLLESKLPSSQQESPVLSVISPLIPSVVPPISQPVTHPSVIPSPVLSTNGLTENTTEIRPHLLAPAPAPANAQDVIQHELWPISLLSAVFNPIIEQTRRLSLTLSNSEKPNITSIAEPGKVLKSAPGSPVENTIQNSVRSGHTISTTVDNQLIPEISPKSPVVSPILSRFNRVRSMQSLSSNPILNINTETNTVIGKGNKATFEHNGVLITTESFEVLNELVVDRGPSAYMSQMELFGDDRHLTTVQADGLVVSTPTGSTAYSLSAGGSIVHPEVSATLVTPICPHTLSFRPMLLPDSMELKVCVPPSSRNTAWASFDGRHRTELRQGDFISITASRYPFPTICLTDQSSDWFNSLVRCLRWNERQRQKPFSTDNAFDIGGDITDDYNTENESDREENESDPIGKYKHTDHVAGDSNSGNKYTGNSCFGQHLPDDGRQSSDEDLKERLGDVCQTLHHASDIAYTALLNGATSASSLGARSWCTPTSVPSSPTRSKAGLLTSPLSSIPSLSFAQSNPKRKGSQSVERNGRESDLYVQPVECPLYSATSADLHESIQALHYSMSEWEIDGEYGNNDINQSEDGTEGGLRIFTDNNDRDKNTSASN